MIKLNGHLITPTIFPDKTSQVWKIPEEAVRSDKDNIILWEFENEAELMHVMQLVSLLRNPLGFDVEFLTLDIPYLPYGRQDKEISNKSTFALEVFIALIDTVFDRVITLDAHSDFVKNYKYKDFDFIDQRPEKEIGFAINTYKPDMLCFPDKGALERYSWIGTMFNVPSFYGEKDRDQSTGYINGYKLQDSIDIKNKTILVIDDIADGAATFCILAKSLQELGAAGMCMYVTHGIFSKGTEIIYRAGYTSIFDKNGLVCI